MTDDEQALALVTGGASGIGFALCRALGDAGNEVMVVDRDAAALARAASTLSDAGIRTVPYEVDLRDTNAVRSMAEVARDHGPIRYACFNAGVSSAGARIWETRDEDFEFVFDVNVGGLVRSIRAIVPLLLEQSTSSAIVVTASMAGLVATPTSAAYCGSKHATVGLTKSLRDDLAAVRDDIRVALLCPGMVKTNLQRTSAAAQPAGGVSSELVEVWHQSLNDLGVDPATVARWVLETVEQGRFWVLPPVDDAFSVMLQQELAPFIDGSAFAGG